MRRTLKKALALMLCIALGLGCITTASAAEGQPTEGITVISDVKAFGEIVTALRVQLDAPVTQAEADAAKVTVSVEESEPVGDFVGLIDYPREVVGAVLSGDGKTVTLSLEEGGFLTDPWNTTKYAGYQVEIGGKTIGTILGAECPDVDKFEAKTYKTPSYVWAKDGQTKTTMSARAFTPDKETYKKPAAGYPLVVWLHGGGETGEDNRIQIAANDVPAWTEKETQDIFGGAYVLAPQNHAFASWTDADHSTTCEDAAAATKSVIDQFIAEKGDIDPNRIYIGGCSYGGRGTWTMLRFYPDFFAAAYPTCASIYDETTFIPFTDEEIRALGDMPIYISQSGGDQSKYVMSMITIHNKLRQAGNRNVHLALFEHSEFPGQDGFVEANGEGVLDHWVWTYLHANYDAKGNDYDGENFIDTSIDSEYNNGKIVVKDGRLTYTYDLNGLTNQTVSLNNATERPEDTGFETIKEWIAAQNLKDRSPGSLTVVRDVKDFGEIVTGLEVVADEPIGNDLDNVKVFVTVDGQRYERKVEDVLLKENGGKEAFIQLEEGGFLTDPWNSVNYQAYEVQIGGRTIYKIGGDKSPDVDKFKAVAYTTPEYQYRNAPKTTMDARYFVPDKGTYKKPAAGYPLVIWLHGGGETGTDNRIHLAANNVPAWTEKESQDVFGGAYVLAPQNHASAGTGAPAATMSVIRQFIKEMGDIDVNRVYIGGCSYGGMGTWQMLRNYPDFFAAAYPICGAVSGEGPMGALTDKEIKSLADLPIYMTVSSGDTIFRFPYGMIETYNRLKAAGNENLHIAMFEHSEFEGQDGFVGLRGVGALDHWSWVYVHNNYDAKGDDFDGRNFLDLGKDGTYNDGRTVVKDGVLTYTFKDGETENSVTLNGKTERPEDTGYKTIKEWIAAQARPAQPFTDISWDAWYYEPVVKAARLGIVNGRTATTFVPNALVTREEFAVMAVRMLKAKGLVTDEELNAYTGTSFTDVLVSSFALKEIAYCADKGIINGVGDGAFAPKKSISRQDAAKILAGALDLDGTAEEFADQDAIAGYAKPAVLACKAAKIFDGKGQNEFKPRDNLRRSEAAKIMVAAVGLG